MKNTASKLYCAIVVCGLSLVPWYIHLQIQADIQADKEPVPAGELRTFTEASACQEHAVREQLVQQAKIVIKKDLLHIKNECYRQDLLAKSESGKAVNDMKTLDAQRAILR